MSDLTPDDEALLRDARLGLEPSRADRSRIKQRIWAQLGLGVGAGASALSASTTANAATAAGASSMATVAKVVGGLLVVAGLAAGGVMALRPPRASVVAVVEVPASVAVPAAPAPSSLPAPVPRATTAPAATETPPVPSGLSEPPWEPETRPTLPAGPSTVAAEADLLRQADAALRSGDPSRAQALLGRYAASIPNGVLVEERDAEAIAVMCALGRSSEARARAAAFLRDHARSPLAPRVRASCGGQ